MCVYCIITEQRIAGADYDSPKAAQSGRSVLSGFFMLVFSFGIFLRTAQACTIILNVKFLPFGINITNFEKSSIVPVIFCCDNRSV